MPRVRIVGSDPGSGIQIDGRTYSSGEVADVSPTWAARLLAEGRAVPAEFDVVRVAEPDVEHRDPTLKRTRRRPR